MITLPQLSVLFISKIASTVIEDKGNERIRLANKLDPAWVRNHIGTIRKMDRATAELWERIAEDHRKVRQEGWGYKCLATSIRTVVTLGLTVPAALVASPLAAGAVSIIVLTPLVHRLLIWKCSMWEAHDPIVSLIHKSAIVDHYLCYALIDPLFGLTNAFSIISFVLSVKVVASVLKNNACYRKIAEEVEKSLPFRGAQKDDIVWLTGKIEEVQRIESGPHPCFQSFIDVYKKEKSDHLTLKTQRWFDAYLKENNHGSCRKRSGKN